MNRHHLFTLVLGGAIFGFYNLCNALDNNEVNKNKSLDKISWNTRNLPIINFGSIKEQKSFPISFPNVNKKKLYTFALLNGPVRNKPIKLLLIAFSLHTPLACNVPKKLELELNELHNEFPQSEYVLKIYRQLLNEPQWTEIGQLMDNSFSSEHLQGYITIEPNGTITISNKDNTLTINMAGSL